jgi:O-antigen ligase
MIPIGTALGGLWRRTGRFPALCALVVVASLLLGGGTRGGFLSDAILQLIAVPLVLASLSRMLDVPLSRQAWGALAFCGAIALVPLIQLIPLPPRIWTALANREPSAAAFELLGREPPWMPISVSPHATWLSALSLLPPMGVFLGTLLLGHRERRWLSLVILAVGVSSVFVGLTQVAQGPESPLRFFEITNPTEAVGFFANRNHFASLLYSLTLFTAGWAVDAALTTGSGPRHRRYETPSIMALMAGFTVLVTLVAAQAMARSRAGLGLTILALFGAFALAFADRRSAPGMTSIKLILGATALAVIFAVQFALYRVLERFAADPLADARIPFARNTIEAAKAYMPIGSGMGTFVPVYAMFEKPEDALVNTFANRAHNDLLEVWLETGVVGPVLIALFLMWLARRSLRLWRGAPKEGRDIDHALARAATIVIALLLAHSLVDYPLRTGGIMALMAFACALLIDPPPGVGGEERVEPVARKRNRSRGARRAVEAAPADLPWPSSSPGRPTEPAPAAPRPADERWGTDIEWPEEWRGTTGHRAPNAAARMPGSRKPPRS